MSNAPGSDRRAGEQRQEVIGAILDAYVCERGGAALWEAQPEEEHKAGEAEHQSWFEANAPSIRGGYQLAWPRRVGRTRQNHQLMVLDGPFVETKEALGGVIVLDAESLEEAAEVAAKWPSLRLYPGAMVELIPTSDG